MFSDEMKVSIPPVGDITQYYLILRHLVDPRLYGGGSNFEGALSFILNSINDKTALFIVSDFIGMGSSWVDQFKAVCGKLDGVFGIMVRDIAEAKLPEGIGNMRLSDPFDEGNVLTANLDKIRKEFDKEAARQEQAIEREFTNAGAGFVKVYTNEPFAKPIVKYMQLMGEA